MISFMVISGERSGSTWAANWLTSDTTLCIHDPLRRWTVDELDGIYPLMDKHKGIACTALQLLPDWVNAHPAPKLVLHRTDEMIIRSVEKLGCVSRLVRGTNERLGQIRGIHIDYKLLFDPYHARDCAEFLGVPFDAHRHIELVQMNVQPHWASVAASPRAEDELVALSRNYF